MHRDVSAKSENDFLEVLKTACNPEKQLYAMLANYKHGKRDYTNMMDLAIKLQSYGETEAAGEIAQDYIKNRVFHNLDSNLDRKENIQFITSFITFISQRERAQIYDKRRKIDNVVHQNGYTLAVLQFAITKELVIPELKTAKSQGHEPNWGRLAREFAKRFDEKDADRVMIDSKIKWYNMTEDWTNLAKTHIRKIEKFGLDTAGINKYFLNNILWDVIFLHCNESEILDKAIGWSKIIVESNPNEPVSIDTYANLLYKRGRINEAIKWEEKAMNLEKGKTEHPNKVYEDTLKKMRSRKPTWDTYQS